MQEEEKKIKNELEEEPKVAFLIAFIGIFEVVNLAGYFLPFNFQASVISVFLGAFSYGLLAVIYCLLGISFYLLFNNLEGSILESEILVALTAIGNFFMAIGSYFFWFPGEVSFFYSDAYLIYESVLLILSILLAIITVRYMLTKSRRAIPFFTPYMIMISFTLVFSFIAFLSSFFTTF